jgi:dihydroflavonol-4-reductase
MSLETKPVDSGPSLPALPPSLVFVTGATGLLGNNLVRALLASGHRVRALVRSEEKARRLLAGLDVEIVKGDMQDVAAFSSMLRGCGAVFHTAAYFREYYQPGDHREALERINVQATLELMAAADAHGVATFVHVSSSGAVGMAADGTPGDEDTPASAWQLENGYFRSKVDGDRRIRAFVPPHGMKVVEILPGWMWGPGDAAPTGAGQLVLDFVAKKVPVVPEGGTSTVDARDVAHAMVASIDRARHGDRFIVGGPYRDLAAILRDLEAVTGLRGPRLRVPFAFMLAFAFFQELAARLFGRKALVTREALRMMKARHAVSSARAERELGARFRPFEDTARDVLAWYAASGMLSVSPSASRWQAPA